MTKTEPNKPHEPTIDVVWPLSRRVTADVDAAGRVNDLNGKTIAELWDLNFRGETIYPLVREYIRSRYPGAKFVDYSNFGNFHGPGSDTAVARLPEQLREHRCDAVIVGIGA